MGATIIDALLVTVGLDPAGYKRGQADVSASQKKLKDDIRSTEDQIAAIRRKSTKDTATQDQQQIRGLQEILRQKRRNLTDTKTAEQDQVKRQKEQTEGLGKMKAAALGLFAALTAGATIKAFVTDIISGDAAMGRLAANLGESAQTATAFGAVIKSLGGDAKEGVAALSNLAAIRFAEKTGDYSKAPVLSRLGVSPADLNDLDSALAKIAATAKTMPKQLFYQYATAAGFSSGAINALELGDVELARQIELAKQREHLDDNWVSLSQDIVRSWNNIRDAVSGAAREMLSTMAPAVKQLGSAFSDLGNSILGDGFFSGDQWAEFWRKGAMETRAMAALLRSVADGIRSVKALLSGDLAGAESFAHSEVLEEGAAWKWWNLSGFGKHAPAPPRPGSGSPNAGVPSADLQRQRSAFAINYLKSQGISDAAARGAIAGSIAESKLDPSAVNPTSGAFGIGQWLGARKARLQDLFGSSPTFDQQLQFLAQELKGGDRGGSAVLNAQNPQAALEAYIRRFERPAAGGETSGDLRRGQQALASLGGYGLDTGLAAGAGVGVSNYNTDSSRSQTSHTDIQIGKIEVSSSSADPRAVANAIPEAFKEQPLVAMANVGLA